jgi:DNA-binding MarR family transcriptional regulator
MKQNGRLEHAAALTTAEQLTISEEPRRVLADLVVELSAIQSLISGQVAFRRAFAGKIYATRRIRNRFFPEDLFAEPAWDILLLLYGVEHSPERLSISAVSASVDAPPTTVLRWIEKLEHAGMILRQKHPTDRRISWLRLTPECVSRLDDFFDQALAIQTAPCAKPR